MLYLKSRRARTRTQLALITALACLAPGLAASVWAADLQGAGKALEAFIQAREAAEAAKKAAPKPDAAAGNSWPGQLEAYTKVSATLPPDQAASQWLALFDELIAMPISEQMQILRPDTKPGEIRMQEPESLQVKLLQALPPPAAWDELAAQIEKRPPGEGPTQLSSTLLRVLAAKFRNDTAGALATVEKLKAESKAAAGGDEDDFSESSLPILAETLETALKEEIGGPEYALEAYVKTLTDRETGADRYYGGGGSSVDLVLLAGEDKARELILRSLKVTPPMTEFSGKATIDLASALALEHLEELNQPVWNLIDGIEDMALYEAMEKKFPTRSEDDEYTRNSADAIYFLALIAANRLDDARALMAKVPNADELFDSSVTGARAVEHLTYQLLRERVEAKPTKSTLELLVSLGASAGKSDETIALLRKLNETPEGEKLGARKMLRRALLAGGKVDEAVVLLREEIAAGGEGKPNAGAPAPAMDQNVLRYMPSHLQQQYYEAMREAQIEEIQSGSLPLELAELGRLMERPEWIEEGLAAYAKAGGTGGDNEYIYLVRRLKRPDLEEKGRIEQLKLDAKPQDDSTRYYGRSSDPASHFAELAHFYVQQGRPQDALELLNGADVFMAADLAELINGTGVCGEVVPVAYGIAAGLLAEGNAAKAREILIAALRKDSDNDDMYALLLKTGPEGVEAALDGLFALDAFEERPLVWKAQFFLDQGRLDEAEAAARQAIAIDPSDGEMGKGDRMRVYGVLSGIMAKKGDEKQSKFLADVVQAIRTSENADDYWSAGLLSHAISLYEKGIGMFADAYCTHSRLALRAAEMGQMDLARQHYQRAYELMPDSFGRVESHCFGCEGVFSSETARDIASEVFGNLVLTTPDKPQVHYLMGYLLESKELKTEALQSYQVAVRLDPDYLNAWEKIQSLTGYLSRPATERSTAALAILRLDPLSRHTSPDYSSVLDWRALWIAYEAAAAKQPAPAADLYPLPASKARLEEIKSKASAEENQQMAQRHHYASRSSRDRKEPPAAILFQTPSGRVISELLATASRSM